LFEYLLASFLVCRVKLTFQVNFSDLDPSQHLFVGIDTRTRPWNEFVLLDVKSKPIFFLIKKLNIILGSLGKKFNFFEKFGK
jgi:hypothetical protein